MKFLYSTLIRIVSILFLKFVKPRKVILFGYGLNTYDGDIKSIYEYYLENSKEYKVFWVTSNKHLIKQFPNQHFIYTYTLKAFTLILTAKVFFIGVSIADITPGLIAPKNRLVIQTNHGIPLKHMGLKTIRNNKKEIMTQIKRAFSPSNYYVLIGSDYERRIYEYDLLANGDNFLKLGHPRLNELTNLNNKPNEKIEIFKAKYEGYKIITYCPTFREKTTFKFFPFHDFSFVEMDNFLSKNNIIFFLKLHPLHQEEIKYIREELEKNEVKNIRIYEDTILNNLELMICSNVLITDYSSIFFDFLVLDKPMIFIAHDEKEYRIDRGLYPENYDEFVPGFSIKSTVEFYKHITDISRGYDYFKERRRILKNILLEYQISNSVELIFQSVSNLLEKE